MVKASVRYPNEVGSDTIWTTSTNKLEFAPDPADGSLQLSWTAPMNDGGDLPKLCTMRVSPC